MSPIDLHPDIVKAINQFAETKLGRKYGRAARSGRLTGGTKIGGKKLLA
jgi:hypothetical protein